MIGSLVRSMQRRSAALSVGDWMNMFKFGGLAYPTTTMGSVDVDAPPDTYAGYAQSLLYANPAVFTCVSVRGLIFSEARFKWRQFRKGQPGDLFGDASLLPLEVPEPRKTTSDLLSVALTFADLGGNWYGRRTSGGIRPMRPDWVQILFGTNSDARSPWDLDAEVIGYVYFPGGRNSGRDPVPLAASEVAHFMPIPDPLAPWRGMSWLTPLIREVMGDNAATKHKQKYFSQGATPNMLVKPPPDMGVEDAKEWAQMFDLKYDGGVDAAFRSVFLGGGADATVVGNNFREMSFSSLQGLAETRVAAASGVGAVLAQFSEGLQGSALNAGNYSSARRRVADATMRPLWTKMVGALSSIMVAPQGSELWYDERHIPFLQEDAADDADIQQKQAVSIRQLTDAGFDPATVVLAITSGDLRRLQGAHSGLFSVQLQKPGSNQSNDQQPNDQPMMQPPRSLEDEFSSLLT